ncbi:MAG TPA: hypothetical protein PLU30_27210 [Verrucomicrobiae bacterium]|nr:hypothetical protein [Verrucomicrobiae bacterium]
MIGPWGSSAPGAPVVKQSAVALLNTRGDWRVLNHVMHAAFPAASSRGLPGQRRRARIARGIATRQLLGQRAMTSASVDLWRAAVAHNQGAIK